MLDVTSEDSISLRGRMLAAGIRLTVRPVGHVWTFVDELPWPLGLADRLAGLVAAPPGGTRRTPVQLGNCDAEVVRAEGIGPADGSGRVVLYFHGSGFVAAGLNTHVRMIARLSREARAPVLSVAYRLASTAPISAAVQDCVDGFRWLLSRGYRPDQIVVAGDSAGGYLAFMVPLALLAAREERPAAVVAISPWVELNPTPKLEHSDRVKSDALFTARSFPAFHRAITNAAARGSTDSVPDELVSPSAEDLSGMPPTLIHVSESEILVHDARLIADRLAAASVPVELKTWAGQVHCFQVFGDQFVPEVKRSLAEIGRYIRQATDENGLRTPRH